MPIKFRCKYCHQRLGIGSRKAGTQVKCPTCSGVVTVPFKDQEGMDDPSGPTEQPLFERSDFDDLFPHPAALPEPAGHLSGTAAPAPAAAAPHPWAGAAPFAFDVERDPPRPAPPPQERSGDFPAPSAGILLSPARATALTVAAIILLAIAFGAGLVVGRFWL
ncbi:MAG TPA: hypothetical protein VKE94_03280 [Gemmataceae bacterium]|jgi:hypothetical protein|nr:hypothetical protein [Gemmataceae bacterium]